MLKLKELKYDEMRKIQGGASAWITGFCTGAAISAFIAPNPVNGGIAIGCAAYGIYDFWT